jgi:large subunit ribosomal protein L21
LGFLRLADCRSDALPLERRRTVFAIIKASGHQFRVEPGAIIAVDGHTGVAGDTVSFDQVLLVGKDAGELVAGAPFVTGAVVTGVIDRTEKSKKVRVFKKKRRKQYRRTAGHRSLLTRVRITDIQA